MGWAIAVDEIDEISLRLGTPAEPIARAGLTARTAGVSQAAAHPELPFFIARSAGTPDPAGVEVTHGVAVTGFNRLELGGEESRLQAWLDGPLRLGQTELVVKAGASGASECWHGTSRGLLRL